ncbi:MAG: haloacid dehalogenase-like hydrolase [Nitrospirae bacterium]|nr:haloacid dehalogenase-like hydrolase [Nitrospirota bacterium]
MRFLLFDIDGTLIDSGGAGVRSLNIAFEEMFGIRDAFRNIQMAGRTDLQIIREGLAAHGITFSQDIVSEMLGAYIRHLGVEMGKSAGTVKPGIRESLETLSLRNGHTLGLLTGNIAEGARIKLAHFGLAPYFDVGAYGDDSEDRNMLLPIAVDKLYRTKSIAVDYKNCVVIGDTPRDVDCARLYGAFSVAVATGPYTGDQLSRAGADVVFEDFSDIEGFCAVLMRDGKL